MKKFLIIGIAVILAVLVIIKVGQFKKSSDGKAILKQSEIALNSAIEMKSSNPEKAVEALEKIIVDFPQTPEGEKAVWEISDFYRQNQELELEKQTLIRLIEGYAKSELTEKALVRLSEINLESLFSSAPTANSTMYEVKPGDSLYKIAKQYNTNVELIQKTNNLTNTLIKPGMKLKIITSVFTLFVSKTDLLMSLKADGELVKTYKVGIGRDNSTPVGQFKLVNRIVDPVWYKTGAIVPSGSQENILGTRWMGFSEPGYGIHGTVDSLPIQEQKTAGCIRMMNNEVEELFIIVPVGTEITIVD
jgi:lipoprotein-anchoring transpeptidase ErfK/SrfK